MAAPATQTEVNRIKVLCVDDDDLVAQVVKITLKRDGAFEWLGHISDAQRLIDSAREHCPDIVLLDIFMPGKDPFLALKELTDLCPQVRAIMYSAYVSGQLIDRAFEAGAWGYVSKDDDSRSLVAAIKRVAGGEVVMSPETRAAHIRR